MTPSTFPRTLAGQAWALYLSLGLVLLLAGKAQSGEVKTFTHENDPASISTWWERVPDGEMATHAKKALPNAGTLEPWNVGWKIHLGSSGPGGSNYLGWLWYGIDTNLYALEQWGNPVVCDAMVVSKSAVLVVYGNRVEMACEIRESTRKGGEMKLVRGTNWWCRNWPNPDLAKIQGAVLRDPADKIREVKRLQVQDSSFRFRMCRITSARSETLYDGNPAMGWLNSKLRSWRMMPLSDDHLYQMERPEGMTFLEVGYEYDRGGPSKGVAKPMMLNAAILQPGGQAIALPSAGGRLKYLTNGFGGLSTRNLEWHTQSWVVPEGKTNLAGCELRLSKEPGGETVATGRLE